MKVIKNISYIILVLLILILFSPAYTDENLSHQASKYAPDKVYNIAKTKKIPLVIIFYADWCADINEYMPVINEVENVNGNKIIFLKVNAEDKQNEDFVKKYNQPNKIMPRTIILNMNFEIIADFIGKKTKQELEEYIKKTGV